MALRLEELAKTIDHSLLDPTATFQDVERTCEEARTHHFAAVCVLPSCVPLAADALRGCDVKVCTVVSYPFGADITKAKVAAAEACITAGADELDIVLNAGALLSGDFRYVRDELAALVRAVRVKSVNAGKGIVLLKVLLHSEQLDDKLKKLACKIVEDAGADFVESATAHGNSATMIRDVELLRDTLPEAIGVKAAGGIDTPEAAEAVIAAGAGRIGTSHAVAVMSGFSRVRHGS
jgi:deoxyribose-phosphate aldolase